MKIVNTGSIYRIYSDDLKVFDKLPAKTFIVRFNKMQGFFLETYSDLEINEEVVYGVHTAKVTKVLNSFKQFKRNLGVILSGDKGIGKSLFARMLCNSAAVAGYPVIVIDCFYPGIHSFIEEITQEVVILLDEFDKTFDAGKRHKYEEEDDSSSAQTSLLSLFDGLSGGKKLYIITCNKIGSLSDYLINRPGRFHYHIMFKYPTAKEVEVYLRDKLSKDRWGEIPKVVVFSRRVDLNYDCLRAIAYEIQNGYTFEESIEDLNILNLKTPPTIISLTLGDRVMVSHTNIDMFSNIPINDLYIGDIGDVVVRVSFTPTSAKYDKTSDFFSFSYEDSGISFDFDDVSPDEKDQVKEDIRSLEFNGFTICREQKRSLRYDF